MSISNILFFLLLTIYINLLLGFRNDIILYVIVQSANIYQCSFELFILDCLHIIKNTNIQMINIEKEILNIFFYVYTQFIYL